MRVLVTGGAGFIGSHLVDELVERNYKVFIIDNLSTGFMRNVNKKADFSSIDLREFARVKDFWSRKKPEIVFHLAAQANVRKSVANPLEDAEINILASLNLLELSGKFGSKFIFSSSGGAIYGDTKKIPTPENEERNPDCPYGCAKLTLEKYLEFYHKTYNLQYTSLRYSNVYGERQNVKGEAGVVGIFFDRMLEGKNPVIYGSGKKTRDFVYVGDVVNANLFAMEKTMNTEYNAGTGEETSILELYGKINSFFGSKFEAKFEEDREGEQLRSCLDIRKIKKELNWKPEVSLDEGLMRIYEWFKERKASARI